MKTKVIQFYKNNKILSIMLLLELIIIVILFFKMFDKRYDNVLDSSNFSKFETYYSSEEISLPSGAYNIKISCESDSDGFFELTSHDHQSEILDTKVEIAKGNNQITTKAWVCRGAKVTDLVLYFNFEKNSNLEVFSVELEESLIYRVVRLLGFILLFVVCDFIVYLFSCKNNFLYKYRYTILFLAAIIFTASIPAFTDFGVIGHDLNFHLERISALSKEIGYGHIPARIYSTMLNGYGYAAPIFYPDLFLYIPAFLNYCSVPLYMSYQIFILIVNAFTTIFTFYLLVKITKDRKIALTGTFLYLLSAYRITDLYSRAALGEYTTLAFLPFVLYGIYNIYTSEENKITIKHYFPLVIGFSGILESHILSLVMVGLFIIFFIMFNLRKTFTVKVMVAYLKTFLCILFLNCWFWVPFLLSMKNMNIAISNVQDYDLRANGLYFAQILRLFTTSNTIGHRSDFGMFSNMPLTLGAALLLGVVVYFYVLLQRKEWKIIRDRKFILSEILACLFILSCFMTTIYFPWNNIHDYSTTLSRILCVIQFPWRYLSIATLLGTCLSVFSLYYLKQYNKKMYNYITALIIISGLVYASLYYDDYLGNNESYYLYTDEQNGSCNIGTGEYLLTDNEGLTFEESNSYASSSEVKITNYTKGKENIYNCINENNKEEKVVLPIIAYENYFAYDKNDKEMVMNKNNEGCLEITVPPLYSGEIKIIYETPILWKICEALSIITTILVIVLVVRSSQKKNLFESE